MEGILRNKLMIEHCISSSLGPTQEQKQLETAAADISDQSSLNATIVIGWRTTRPFRQPTDGSIRLDTPRLCV